jgi:hypothetical protein
MLDQEGMLYLYLYLIFLLRKSSANYWIEEVIVISCTCVYCFYCIHHMTYMFLSVSFSHTLMKKEILLKGRKDITK